MSTPHRTSCFTFTLTTGDVPLYAVTATTDIAAVVGGVVHITAHAIGTKRKAVDGEGERENHPRRGVVHGCTVIASVLLGFTLTCGDFRIFADHAASTIAGRSHLSAVHTGGDVSDSTDGGGHGAHGANPRVVKANA